MKVNYLPEYPVTDKAAQTATGKTLKEWYAIFDERGGPSTGRRNLNNFLYKEQGVEPWWATTISVEYERARDVRKRDGTLAGYSICVTKTIKTSAMRAFEAFEDPSTLTQWFGADPALDFEVGGRFSNADGNTGIYKKIQPGKAIKFTWEGQQQEQDSMVEVKFDSKGEAKCGLILTHDRIANRAEADGLRACWGEAIGLLKDILEEVE